MPKEYHYNCFICGDEFVSNRPIPNASNMICSDECQREFDISYPTVKQCLYCGKKFHVIKGDVKFCSYDCKRLYCQENRPEQEYMCDNCGQTFTTQVKKHNQYKFCSWECYQKFQRKRVFKPEITCEICGRKFIRQYPSQRFCSVQCQCKWQSTQRGHVPMPRKDSSIETIIKGILTNKGISYINNKHFSYYEVDAYLPDFNLGIEVMGGYWHGDNRLYPKISQMQLQSAYRDKRKHTFISNHQGFNILYLWENEANNNQELCELLIEKYIANKGVLENYHSFNYLVKDNELKLQQNLIKPYMEWTKDELKAITA